MQRCAAKLAEFPPAKSGVSEHADSLSEALKQAVRESGRSVHDIAKEAGVSEVVLERFLSGERDIRMATANKLADILGLKLAAG